MTEKNAQPNQKSKKDQQIVEDKARNTYCQVPILEKVLVPSPGYQTRLYSLQVLSVAEAKQYYQDISQQCQKNRDSDKQLCHRDRSQQLRHGNRSQELCHRDRSQELSPRYISQELCDREISQELCDREQSHSDRSPPIEIRWFHVNCSSHDCRHYKAKCCFKFICCKRKLFL